ncbi:MAG: electron transport complex subunit E [Eubacteriales bacterium]|nr:electron transport complex subunit E [Eubacteriales bacterium]
MKIKDIMRNGLITENPVLVMMLGMCPTLAVTTAASNGIGMGLSTTAVLVMSNLFISLLRNIIPDKVRIPAYIVIIASFVTIIGMLLKAYVPALDEALGIYIPLIVVNCVILARAEAFAAKNTPVYAILDGIFMGLGFTIGLTIIAAFRELLGNGTVFGIHVMPASYEPISIFVLAPGAFFVLAMLTAIQNKLGLKSATNKKEDESEGCAGCSGCKPKKKRAKADEKGATAC